MTSPPFTAFEFERVWIVGIVTYDTRTALARLISSDSKPALFADQSDFGKTATRAFTEV
jgi:hypothetical protein